ncbi:DUF3618 domain-containing protein [Streptomyces sp. NBC_01497]|uniref:DUF3618 domain-containing protein n=1 Tax=Streptomyces sp. NBC_01497 TaxID=2903885 RepID=UPI002E32FFE3|nr:DUF3618 domain-containing protein [Streptomyces sp. NBC_01497]
MTDEAHDDVTSGAETAESMDELRAEVEDTRARLGSTVEALAAKTDVVARAKEKAAALKGRVQDSTPEPLREKAQQARSLARRNRTPVLAAGAGAVLVAALAVRRARRKGK